MQQNVARNRTPNKLAIKELTPIIPKSALKLAVALQLKYEGCSNILFDKFVKSCGRKVCIHVLGEDDLGLKLAVYCINRKLELDPNDILDTVTAIQREVGDDGDVAIAIPIIFWIKPRISLD